VLALDDAPRQVFVADGVRELVVTRLTELALRVREVVHPAPDGVMERDQVAVRALEVLDP
jgi:hypothetical protein